MTDVFLSYKAEDRQRVQSLVEALEADGLSVWWDAHIGGGEEWRRSIENHLDRAKCVLVVWSRRSTGPDGRFVRDEASRAQRRDTYLPVRIDKVDSPLGFGETQALNLIGWKGERADPRYRAVLEAIRATTAGTASNPHVSSTGQSRLSRRDVIAAGTAAVAISAVGAWALLEPDSAAASGSIAVLPFANLSGDPSQAYFSDGVAEELRSALSRVDGLKVVARTSSEMVRDDDAKSAARKLGVANILTGSVRRSPSTVRVSAQLVEARTGLNHWSETYDRPLGDALQMQTDIAQQVAAALSVQLGESGRASLSIGGTRNSEAHDLFLKAIAIRQSDHSEANFGQAIDLFDAATRLDPRYADAYAQKAITLADLTGAYSRSAADLEKGYAEGMAVARKAIALAPNLPSAHAALATALAGRLDLRGALTEYLRAGARSGGDAEIVGDYSRFLGQLGYSDKALDLALEAATLDPLNPRAYAVRSYALFYGRRYADAASSALRVLKMSPKRAASLTVLGDSLLLLGKSADARAAYVQAPNDDPFRLAGEAILEARLGNRRASDRLLERNVRLYGDAVSYQQAQVQAQRGEIDKAFATLDRALRVRDPGLISTAVDPFLDPLRQDSRFQAFLDKMNFPKLGT